MVEKTDPIKAAFAWWAKLTGPGGDSGARSRLRRATIDDALIETETMALAQALGWTHHTKLPRVAALAIALACIRESDTRPFGRAIGRKSLKEDTSAALSMMRYSKMMRAKSDDDFVANLRRAIHILNGKANVFDVARLTLFRESREVRDRLAIAYFAVREAA